MGIETTFREQGVVKIPALIAPEIRSGFLHDVESVLEAPHVSDPKNMRCRYALMPATGEQILDAIDPIVDICQAARTIAGSPGLIDVLGSLLEDEPVLFKDKYLLRRPRAPGYPPHQDFIAWPFFPKTFTTALIALDDMHAGNGALAFYVGSHALGYLGGADGDFNTVSHAQLSSFRRVVFHLDAGDALLFNGLVVHESSVNESAAPRRGLYLSFNAKSDGGDQRRAHYAYFHSWLKRRFGEYGAKELYFN